MFKIFPKMRRIIFWDLLDFWQRKLSSFFFHLFHSSQTTIFNSKTTTSVTTTLRLGTEHNMHVNLLFCTKGFLFLQKQSLWAKDSKGIFELGSSNHSFPGMICWVSENHRCNLFRVIETKNAAPFIHFHFIFHFIIFIQA